MSAAAHEVNPGPALSKERVKQILDARESLDRALELMRIICSAFDTDGELHFATEVLDLRAGLGQAIGHIKKASDLLFEVWFTGEDAQESQAFMDALWDSADIVFCVNAALQVKKLPSGHGMTVCPVRGALTVAISKIDELVGGISAFLKLNRKRGVRASSQ